MSDFDFNQIDDVIHSRIRTAVMAVLVAVDEADFTHIRNATKATDGNLSVHLKKLEEAGYITSNKLFVNKKPLTRYKLTSSGRKSFESYIKNLEDMLKAGKNSGK